MILKFKVTVRKHNGKCVFRNEYLTDVSPNFRETIRYQVCADYPEAADFSKYRIDATELRFNGSTYEI